MKTRSSFRGMTVVTGPINALALIILSCLVIPQDVQIAIPNKPKSPTDDMDVALKALSGTASAFAEYRESDAVAAGRIDRMIYRSTTIESFNMMLLFRRTALASTFSFMPAPRCRSP